MAPSGLKFNITAAERWRRSAGGNVTRKGHADQERRAILINQFPLADDYGRMFPPDSATEPQRALCAEIDM